MLPAGFEPAIPGDERAQTHALDCATTGNACDSCLIVEMPDNVQFTTFFLLLFSPLAADFRLYRRFFLLVAVCRFTYV